jgi:hypothetical protein
MGQRPAAKDRRVKPGEGEFLISPCPGLTRASFSPVAEMMVKHSLKASLRVIPIWL